MASNKPQLRLGGFLMASGHHIASWRHPDAVADVVRGYDKRAP